MACSTDFVRSQLHAMAKTKIGALAKLRLGGSQVAELCDAWAGEIAKRFGSETVARAMHQLSIGHRGWPELYDVLDACRDACRDSERALAHGDGDHLGQSLRNAGIDPLALAGLGYDCWAPMFEFHRRVDVPTLRMVVAELKDGAKLIKSPAAGHVCAWFVGELSADARFVCAVEGATT